MRVRWTTDAADDLERICDYIAETNPDSARRIARTIVDGVASLHTLPNRGRLGRVEGTREFVFAPLPLSLCTKCGMRCKSYESSTVLSSGRRRRPERTRFP